MVDLIPQKRDPVLGESTSMPRISFGAFLILVGMFGGGLSVCATILYEAGSIKATMEDGIASERSTREHESSEYARQFQDIRNSQADMRADLRDVRAYLLSTRPGTLQHTPDEK